jgi:hypothetical protein
MILISTYRMTGVIQIEMHLNELAVPVKSVLLVPVHHGQ